MKKIFFLIVFLLTITFVNAQEKQFQKACKKNTLEEYDKFLKKYSQTEFAQIADYKKAKLVNTKNCWYDFTIKYSSGVYSDTAFKILCKIECKDAKSANTIESYKAYLQKYSKCNNIGEIMESYYNLVKNTNTVDAFNDFIKLSGKDYENYIDEIAYLKAEKINTIDEWKTFLQTYKNSKYENDAKIKIDEFAWQNALTLNTLKAFRDVYLTMPNYQNRAVEEIRKIYHSMFLTNKIVFDTICSENIKFSGNTEENLTQNQKKEISHVLASVFDKSYKIKSNENCKIKIEIEYDQSIWPSHVTNIKYQTGSPITGSEKGGTEYTLTYKITDIQNNISYINVISEKLNDGYIKKIGGGIEEININGVVYGVSKEPDIILTIDRNKTIQLMKETINSHSPLIIDTYSIIEILKN